MRTRGFLASLAVPLFLVAGCDGGSSTTATDPATTTSSEASPSASASSEPKGPQCADVWVAGDTLSRGYDGCYEGEKRVRASGRYCEFGKPLITYDDRFYAVRSGRIAEAGKPFADDAGYQGVLAKCSG